MRRLAVLATPIFCAVAAPVEEAAEHDTGACPALFEARTAPPDHVVNRPADFGKVAAARSASTCSSRSASLPASSNRSGRRRSC